MSNSALAEVIKPEEWPPEGWIIHRCEDHFPFLEANSELGGKMLQLTADFTDTATDLREQSLSAEEGQLFTETETDELMQRWIDAKDRWNTADELYLAIEYSLANTQAPYEEVVEGAAAMGLRQVKKTWGHLPEKEEELTELCNELAGYYVDERDRHFQRLTRPSEPS